MDWWKDLYKLWSKLLNQRLLTTAPYKNWHASYCRILTFLIPPLANHLQCCLWAGVWICCNHIYACLLGTKRTVNSLPVDRVPLIRYKWARWCWHVMTEDSTSGILLLSITSQVLYLMLSKYHLVQFGIVTLISYEIRGHLKRNSWSNIFGRFSDTISSVAGWSWIQYI